MEKQIRDKDLGIVKLRWSMKAKRYSLRVQDGVVIAVLPARGNEQTLLNFINQKRNRLIAMLKKQASPQRILNEATELQTYTFRLHIFRTGRENFYMTLNEGVLHIACPQHTDFEDARVQQLLKGLIGKALRHEAHRILPKRLKALALQHGFKYNEIKITGAKTRWGSCSAHRNINLNLSLMLLPEQLIDYVLLHELCHTMEMNHSERFWDLLNSVTENKARQLRKELKGRQML
ncbi:MAG: zinc protease [Bacteroidales bacterium]